MLLDAKISNTQGDDFDEFPHWDYKTQCCPLKNQDARSFGGHRTKNKDLIVTN